MNIIDTYESFPKQPTLERLREYHINYGNIFEFYFLYHCTNTEERLNKAIERYSYDWHSIQKVYQNIGIIIENTAQIYHEKYQLEFPIDINLIIGAYGSNAYANRKIIPDITFAMERLTFEAEPLQVIVAHEFGHVAHNLITNQEGMDWKKVRWEHPYTWLLQEGAATHFSKQIYPNLSESIYFSYSLEGDEWFTFAKKHKQDIISSFANELRSGKEFTHIYKEWFSINGGETFGYSRLAYFIADCLFQDLSFITDELHTLLLWKNEAYFQIVDEWLNQW